MKILYRTVILLVVFVCSLLYFGSHMQEKVFREEKTTTRMQETTLPVITLQVEGTELNLLHGYCSSLDEMLLRESITPLGAEKELELWITENEYNIKKVNYEIYETVTDTKVEEGAVISLEKQTAESNGKTIEKKVAKIRLKNEYLSGNEYVVKFTLISNESKRIYYYTRFKLYTDSHLAEKLAFVEMFHSSLLDKEKAQNVERYLETKRNADETDFATANIYNSLDFLSYGTLAPVVLYEEVPTVTEYTKDTASVVREYYLQITTDAGPETYFVTENYRFQYTASRVYLYNYERTMEALFDVENTSLAKSEFKFGITADTDLEVLANQDNSRIAFVRGGSLYVYMVADNTLTTVFTFLQEDTDYIRDTYNKHGIRLLSVDDTGAVDFLVYGYMNRGEYEGRVGMILYTYHPADQTTTERAYFPMNTTYEILKETMGEFSYCNNQEIFYFHIYNTIYSYNLITGVLTVLAEGVTEDTMVYSRENQMLAWQSRGELGRTDTVHILDLDTGTKDEIRAGEGEILGLLGMIDTNLILGTSPASDVEIREDGTRLAAYRRAAIVDFEGNEQKTYEKDGYYITAALVEGNVVTLSRVTKSGQGERIYGIAESDYILNQARQEAVGIQLSERVTERMRTEYYLSLPSSVIITAIPEVKAARNTVITEDVTVRVNVPEYFRDYYITYAYGTIGLLSEYPGEAIVQADESTGSVIGSNGHVIWSRGVKSTQTELSGIGVLSSSASMNSLMTCVKLLLNYRNVEADVLSYQPQEMLLTDWLEQYLKTDVLKLSGVTLDEALYYVYLQNPVIAVSEGGTAILITAYDRSGINAIVPSQGRSRRMTMKEAESFLGENDYYFLTVQ